MACEYCKAARETMKRAIEAVQAHKARFAALARGEKPHDKAARTAATSDVATGQAVTSAGDEPPTEAPAAHRKRGVAKAARGRARS